MSSLEPRGSGPPSRRRREQRAYRLVLVGGTAGAVAVVTFVLAIFGVMGFGIPIFAVLIALACYFLFRRTVGV
jgi:hypothetical protein